MCIHHLKFHAPCGHTKQLTEELVYCNPVARALGFYTKQPDEALHHRGRFAHNPMKAPQPCGGCYIRFLRNLPPSAILGQDRTFVPEGWQPKMTIFTRALLDRREDFQSIIILTETEFPQMAGRISERWVHHLFECFQNPEVIWAPPQDLQNDHFAGNIITETVQHGCGRSQTGNPSCFEGWKNPYGGIAVCPIIWMQETGQPMPRRPDHEVADLLPGTNNPAPFHEWFQREMQLQAQDYLELYSIDIAALETSNASSPMIPLFAASIVQSPHAMATEHHGLVAGVRESTKSYRWPPTLAPEDQRSHSKSASI
ncbi:MAG: hypothetical protein Q9171_005511 [Xanthocarpia ochracea]